MVSKLARDIPNMTYYCTFNSCKIVSGEILKQLGPIQQQVNENSQRIETLEKAVDAQNNLIEQNVADEVENCIGESIEQKVKKMFEIEKDRAARSSNVILQNVREGQA